MLKTQLIAALLLVWVNSSMPEEHPWDCLHAVGVGQNHTKVEPCEAGDALGIGKLSAVRLAMAYLAIDPARVRFNGCKHGFFATGPDPLHPDRYLITYPVGVKDRALAPITHELAHVMQMEITGGREQLERQQRKPMQIELGADFISGIVFAAKFGNLNRGEFQNNLALTGEYDAESTSDPHGTPSERDAAFRFGLNFSFRKDVPDVRVASSYFRDVLYEEAINQ